MKNQQNTANQEAPSMPTPVLKPDTIYAADNGRLICLKCAGTSAKYTGRDISGQEVMAIEGQVMAEWFRVFPLATSLSCESGCTMVSKATGSPRVYYRRKPSDASQIIAIRHGENGYHETTVFTQEHADRLNEMQGITAADIPIATMCSMFDRWSCFEEFKASGSYSVELFDKHREMDEEVGK